MTYNSFDFFSVLGCYDCHLSVSGEGVSLDITVDRKELNSYIHTKKSAV